MRLCARYGIPIVPQGGNTGLVGGSIAEKGAIVVSLARLNRVRALDPINNTITVDAGCLLADVQNKAAEANRLFPLSLAAEGSCQVGGNLATNAGGVNVLRYGNMRDLALGLEVVLPDGRIWNGLRGLRKDNTGYDLKNLFIGSEGTLGIITGAVLKLFPETPCRETALLASASPEAASELLNRARSRAAPALAAFELISGTSVELVRRYVPTVRIPVESNQPWYVLIELAVSEGDTSPRGALENLFEQAFKDGIVSDGVLAESTSQREMLWSMRESITEAQKIAGASLSHDISVPVSLVARFLDQTTDALQSLLPGIRISAFGHMGDGNIHYNLIQPVDSDPRIFLDREDELSRIVYDKAVELGGSFSAEHGIGKRKIGEMVRYTSDVERNLMSAIKTAIDPNGLLNPGCVLI